MALASSFTGIARTAVWIQMPESVHIVWFKRDLRVHDHRPLEAAALRGPVLPLYIVEPGYGVSRMRRRGIGTSSRNALANCQTILAALASP